MCKITDYQYDEAILAIRPHAPKAAQIIEQYVDQLKREKMELMGERDGLRIQLFGTLLERSR